MSSAEQGVREICFDTETTGFHANGEDRITEIGCIEIIDLLPTGRTFHRYVHPRRDIPEKVTQITGITLELLEENGAKDFKDVAQDFLDFIGDSQLVAHNADFDRGFINAELARNNFDVISPSRFTDTLRIAREKYPGSPASLDALCKRFDISLAARDTHGAIIDSQLLAGVYLELRGGRAHVLDFGDKAKAAQDRADQAGLRKSSAPPRPSPLAMLSSAEERSAHASFIAEMGESAFWYKYDLERESEA